MQYKLKLPKQGSINHLQEEMARLSGLNKSKVCVWCVWWTVSAFFGAHVPLHCCYRRGYGVGIVSQLEAS